MMATLLPPLLPWQGGEPALEATVREVMQLLLALACALVIGWEREKEARSAGLRTFPLVAVGCCAFVLLGRSVFAGDDQAQARVLYGLMTGIGFIGGGAILKGVKAVHGTATAASIWNTAAVGAGIAFERYPIAIALTVLNFVVLRVTPPIKRHMKENGSRAADGEDEEVADEG